MIGAAVVAVDVGTGSARAGVFGPDGRMLGRAERPIALHRPMPDHAEQSSEEIWSALAWSVPTRWNTCCLAPVLSRFARR